ncbi:uncharacterized protein BDW43DRAFT_260938 [Aspergillus alliaceus]|uniref:uncharacterized protein n=1 Tax=Petromyces alliaceus TaxID=209559 RepID=UPI0012A604BF|nr:uncharacterized protein BDW43DRAFT_260938 [Aspergillus alliaceus]KAB8239236.1 hypothetical protein BDW43DRAFT_260938 [Aspergillus alliaceus]
MNLVVFEKPLYIAVVPLMDSFQDKDVKLLSHFAATALIWSFVLVQGSCRTLRTFV